MNKFFTKQHLVIIALSVSISFLSFWAFSAISKIGEPIAYDASGLPTNYVAANSLVGPSDNPMVDFTRASMTAIPAVVHITTTFPSTVIKQPKGKSSPFGGQNDPFFDDFFDGFFGFGPQVVPEQQAAGSGVVVTADGYIVTNNHVISDERGNVAKEINVTFSNRQEYKAELIGNDPNSDLAVIKINAKNLPYLVYGNSDEVSIGQWVLAVGYPLNLDATVTAGIISAKSRTLGINYRNQADGNGGHTSAIESFLQTDAAVNKGNSGGALVNLRGEFIGVNSAIATPTGYYSGYSFSIPSNIVKKIANDIIKYGKAQRGYLGIEFQNRDGIPKDELKKRNIYDGKGVYINKVLPDGAAQSAGLKEGDIITHIDDSPIDDGAALSAKLAMYKPGDKVKVTYKRKDDEKTITVTLKNSLGTYEVSKKKSMKEELGATFKALSDKERETYKIRGGGLQVSKIAKDGLLSKTRMDEGFIIISVSGRVIESEQDFIDILEENRGRTLKLEGFYPNSDGLYSYPITVGE